MEGTTVTLYFMKKQIYAPEITWGYYSGAKCTLPSGTDPKETDVQAKQSNLYDNGRMNSSFLVNKL
jgi:hypothetical protein